MTSAYPSDADWPSDFQGCTFTGKFVGLDGTPLTGTVTLQASTAWLTSLGTKTVVSTIPLVINLESVHGTFSKVIPATDDTDIIPFKTDTNGGWSYTATVALSNKATQVFPGLAASLSTPLDISLLFANGQTTGSGSGGGGTVTTPPTSTAVATSTSLLTSSSLLTSA